MDKCYFCGRTDDEIKEYIILQLKSEMDKKIQPISKLIEQKKRSTSELEEKWNTVRRNIPNDIIKLVDFSMKSLLQEIDNVNVQGIREIINLSQKIIGPKALTLKLSEIEEAVNQKINETNDIEELQKKVEKITNETEKNIEIVCNEKDLITMHQQELIMTRKFTEQEIEEMNKRIPKTIINNKTTNQKFLINISVCKLCFGLNMPRTY